MASPTLIISNARDGHIPFVTRHLSEQPVILDGATLLTGSVVSYTYAEKQLRLRYDTYDLSNTASVWVRRPAKPENWTLPVAPNYASYSQSALTETLQALYSILGSACWVSDYYAIERANSKPYQQSVARQFNWSIPDTLYTSDPAEAKHFLEQHGTIITKPLAADSPHTAEGHELTFFSTTMKTGNTYNFEGLHVAPAIFQQNITVKHEYRVTVISNQIFAAEIHLSGQRTAHVRDWRFGHIEGAVDFSATKLPASIASACVRLTKKLGLLFGAIDLILDTHNVWWFLEINPNGQWAFIEVATKQPIGATLAALLEGRTLARP